MAAKLDLAIDHGPNIDWSDLKEFGRIVDQIVVTPATTIEGLCVKARVGCWGLLGDLDDPGEETPAGERITLSIIRDLDPIVIPDLERPGALTKLVREIEEPAVIFSTMSLARHAAASPDLQLFGLLRSFAFADRTPAPPPFSSMNSTPARSNACFKTARVARRGPVISASIWRIVTMPSLARSASSC